MLNKTIAIIMICENIKVNNNYDDIVVYNHLFCTFLIEKCLIEILCHKCKHMF